jgi:hypothetical protein
MNLITVDPSDLTPGQEVTVWYTRGSGQGGRFLRIVEDAIEIETPNGNRSWALAAIDRIEIEIPHEAEECLEYNDDCQGPVELHTVGSATRAWPRCRHHADQRYERYENSIERYADSDVPPSWFDPSYAGESWDGE